MKNNIDWDYLKRPLVLLFFALLLSTSLIVAGSYYEKLELRQFENARSALQSTHSRYTKLVDDLDLLQIYTQTYNEFRSNGLIGNERRLSWIETLDSVNEVLELPKLTYTLMPQEEFKRPKLRVEQNINVSSTPMSLDMELLHEEDLFAVFEGIEEKIDNLFTVDSCNIRLIGSLDKALNTKEANLRARCLMRWVLVDVQGK